MDVFLGQGLLQIGELLLAFLLSSLVGLERQLRGKAAGIRTQAIVGTSSALFLLVSKYGFADVIGTYVRLDPSRIASQIVTGIGFLGAGIILTRRGAVRGLTTAASVWETAAIGMAAAAGLWVLACVVTVIHFVIAYLFAFITAHLPRAQDVRTRLEIVYRDGRGLLRELLQSITAGGWSVMRAVPHRTDDTDTAALSLELVGTGDPATLVTSLTALDGVHSVSVLEDEDLE
ncbi:MAG TPA: MgtC/SapB family protein [Microbacterium sp.]|nr:MgtC/SapB family protein [Microbacterium sp.]